MRAHSKEANNRRNNLIQRDRLVFTLFRKQAKAHTSRRSLICRHNRIKEKHEYEPPRYNTFTCWCQGHAVSSENLCVLLLLLFSLYLALILIIRQAQNNHFTQSRSLKAPDRTCYLRMLTQTMGGDARRIQIDLNSPIQLMHREQQMTFTNVILQCGAHRLGTGSPLFASLCTSHTHHTVCARS